VPAADGGLHIKAAGLLGERAASLRESSRNWARHGSEARWLT
jgi:hypothetical protein